MRGSGGGGGGGRGPTARQQSGQRFFSPKLFYSFQMGSNIFHDGPGGGGGGGATSSRGGSRCFL